LFGTNRPAQQIALSFSAAEEFEELKLWVGLDAFRHNLHTEATGHQDDSLHDDIGACVCPEI
jgi:hypothetical protein